MSRSFETGFFSYPVSGKVVTLYTDITWTRAFKKVAPHIRHLVIKVLPCRREDLTILAATTLQTLLRSATNISILTLRVKNHPVRLSEISLASTEALFYVYPAIPPLTRDTPTHHFPIVSIRKQLEDVNPPHLRILRLPKTSITALIALRWGVIAEVPSGLMATPVTSPTRPWINIHDFIRASENPFWQHVVEVDVQLVKWWDIVLPGQPRGSAFGASTSVVGRTTDDNKAVLERYRAGIIALHDWLSHLSANLEVLRFEWLALDQQTFVPAPSARALIEGYQAEEPRLLSDGRHARRSRGPNIFGWDEVDSDVERVGTIWFGQTKIVWRKLREVWLSGMGPVWAQTVQDCAEGIEVVGWRIDGVPPVYRVVKFVDEAETEDEAGSDGGEEGRARRAAVEGLRRGIMGGLGLDA